MLRPLEKGLNGVGQSLCVDVSVRFYRQSKLTGTTRGDGDRREDLPGVDFHVHIDHGLQGSFSDRDQGLRGISQGRSPFLHGWRLVAAVAA